MGAVIFENFSSGINIKMSLGEYITRTKTQYLNTVQSCFPVRQLGFEKPHREVHVFFISCSVFGVNVRVA